MTGFMGAGKSEVGSRLAGRMGIPFVDLDARIESRSQLPVAAIIERRGEAAFRDLEHQSLSALCNEPGDLVVATGGGLPTFERNRSLLRANGTSLWLDPPFEVILKRLGPEDRARRPLLGSDAAARELFEERRRAYRAAADLRLRPAAGESPDETVESALALLGHRGRIRPDDPSSAGPA